MDPEHQQTELDPFTPAEYMEGNGDDVQLPQMAPVACLVFGGSQFFFMFYKFV